MSTIESLSSLSSSLPSSPLTLLFICPQCHKSFSTKGNMKNHIQTIHKNIRPFKCPYPSCKKEYSNQSRLDVHIRTHTGSKPFMCPICSKSFNEKGNLKTHINFHTDKRPFKCNQCEKTYKTNGHLKDHIEIQHMQLRRFICEICSSKFGRRSTLVAHMRTHTGEKSFKCKIEGCEKRFAEKGNMEMHYKRHLKRIMNEKEINTKKDIVVNFEMVPTRPSSYVDIGIGYNENYEGNKEVLNEENDYWKYENEEFSIDDDKMDNVFCMNFLHNCRKDSTFTNVINGNNNNNNINNNVYGNNCEEFMKLFD